MSTETGIVLALFVGMLTGFGCAFLGIRFHRVKWIPLAGGLGVMVVFALAVRVLTSAAGGA